MKSNINRVRIVAALLAALTGSGCDGWGGPKGQIRVVTDPPEASIFCNGIAQEASPVEIRHLPAGTYLVMASKSGYRPARKTIDVLLDQRTAVELKLEPLTGLALVESTPSGADVTIDGAWRGKTPFYLTDLAMGVREFSFEAAGCLPRTMEISVEDRVPRRVHGDLILNSGQITVRSQPEGAEVQINGVVRGTTPCENLAVPAGESRIDVRMEGYVPFTEQVVMAAQESRSLVAVLEVVPSRFTVVSIPAGARVYVGDQYRGDTPLTLTDLPVGLTRVRVELSGYEAMARNVTLSSDAPLTEEFRLTRNSAKLVIVSEPAGAAVSLNGQEYGVTVAEAGTRMSRPLEIDLLPPAQYQVQLVLRGYLHAPRTVRLGVNEVLDLHEKMTRRFIADTRVRIKGQTGEVVRDGMLLQPFPNGDIELQLETGSIMKIRAEDILSTTRMETASP